MSWRKLFGSNKTKQQPIANSANTATAKDIKVVILSDLGNIRTNNEDAGLFVRMADDAMEKGCLLMVADGMGGHQAGEVASKMATEIVSREYFKNDGNSNIEKQLSKVFTLANKNIFDAAAANPAQRGMGTTCTALVVNNQHLYYAHVGDSRAYILKQNTISRITQDHTYVQELVNKGEITAAEAEEHPQRNILTNAMGTKPQVRVDAGKAAMLFEDNDRLLLCSDGLYDYLNDDELAAILSNTSLQEAAAQMVEEAKKRGGHDNITVVLAERENAITTPVSKETRDIVLPVTKEIDLP
ncbi:MAG: Stp1/IreP family PP2C-type Ser/Thr phosphatase [Chitinophagaceae bacterium]